MLLTLWSSDANPEKSTKGMGGGKTNRLLQGVVCPLKASSYVPPFDESSNPLMEKHAIVLVAEFQAHLLHCQWTALADCVCSVTRQKNPNKATNQPHGQIEGKGKQLREEASQGGKVAWPSPAQTRVLLPAVFQLLL